MKLLLILSALAAALAAQSTPSFDELAKSADAARDSGKLEQAVVLYKQALHEKPDWRQGWWVVGSILYDAGKYKEAEEAFLPLTALDPDKSPGWAMAGLCEFEIKHYQDSLINLRKASQLGLPPSLFDVTQYHAYLILIRTEQFDLAIEEMSRVAAKKEETPKLVEAMGLAGLAKPVLPQDLSAPDRQLATAVGRAMCDGAANNGKAALSEFGALVSQYPKTPRLHYLYGMVLLESDADKAVEQFKQELAVAPNNTQALISLASEYKARNDYHAALPYAEKAVKDEPRYFAAHTILGKLLIDGNLDVPRGIKELQKAVELAPASPQSHLALASAYTKLGRNTEAATQRAEFLRLRSAADAGAPVKQ